VKHVVIRNPFLKGWEYGMLRALENTIIETANAEVVNLPDYGREKLLEKAQHGMRLSPLRKLIRKKKLNIEADVVWCILMGPENMMLDLFTGWQHIKHRIVYLFDTLVPQFPLIKSLFSSDDFNIKITSFNDAKEDLEKITSKKWHVIEQAATEGLFYSVPFEQKQIQFSSYGRKWPALHEALLEFSKSKNLYYDFTTHDAKHPIVEPELLYRQYAWHLNHSLFTFSWPVELTNPSRAGHLHPITCRWFEAACAGTVMIGKKPGNEKFDEYLFPNAVVEMDPSEKMDGMLEKLEKIWDMRKNLYDRAYEQQKTHYSAMIWSNRVRRMLELIDGQSHRLSASTREA
jgi:hypothetical protein